LVVFVLVDPSRVVLVNQHAVADGGASTVDREQIVHLVTSG
jgi:hypothetical protein